MPIDPITEEIREIKRSLAREFDNDLERIGADLRRRERESGRTFAKLPKRPVRTTGREDPVAREEEFAGS